jgi:hypothetical protein
MNIHEIQDLSNEHVINILKQGLSNIDDERIIENYSPTFSEVNSNLFYVLKDGRYKNGMYYVMEENGEYLASAGWNQYDDSTALVLTRAFISKSHRAKYIFAETCLPKMLEACSDFDKVWITCNKYNKTIYDWFCLAEKGKRPALFNNWPDIYRQFQPIGIKSVYNTEQYVVQLRK